MMLLRQCTLQQQQQPKLFQRHLHRCRFFSSHQQQQGNYQSIGSFHSENLAHLMSLSDADYIPPELPFENSPTASAATNDLDSYDVGDDFLLDLEQWTFLNHGAFGAALRPGYERAEAWRHYLERQPLRYFDRDLLPHLAYSCRLLGRFLQKDSTSTSTSNINYSNMTLLPNVTSGMNCILAGYVRHIATASLHQQQQQQHHVVLWDTSYGSVKKMTQHYVNNPEQDITYVPFQERYLNDLAAATTANDQSSTEQVFVHAIEDTILQNQADWDRRHIQQPLFILDHTSSNTALTFPVQTLAERIKHYIPQAIVVVDGAHGLLAQPFCFKQDFPSVDIYVTNAHKWFAAPRGVAIMAVQDNEHTALCRDSILQTPAVISHGVDEPDLLSRFVWDGTRDYAAALSIPAVAAYWNKKTPSFVQQKMAETLRRGIHILADMWHGITDETEWPGNVTLASFSSSVLSPMALVRLPSRINDKSGTMNSNDAKRVQDYLYHHYIEAPIKCINGQLYVRVSCHVYNKCGDFIFLGVKIKNYAGRVH